MLNTPGLLGRFLERLTQWQADIAILAQHPDLAAVVALTAFQPPCAAGPTTTAPSPWLRSSIRPSRS